MQKIYNRNAIEWKKFNLLDLPGGDEELIAQSSLLSIVKGMRSYIGDTSFRLTQEMCDIIDNQVDGVEYFRVITPYKFVIGIGSLFLDPIVKKQVAKKIGEYLKSKQTDKA